MDLLGFVIPNWLLVIVFLLVSFYFYLTWHHGTLKALGIAGPRPVPLLGDFHHLVKEGFHQVDVALTQKYGKIYSFYNGRIPTIVIGDTDIIKEILVKDFADFTNRSQLVMRGLMKLSLFDARDERWKHVRSLLTPCFSSGKLKQMTDLIVDASNTLADNLEVLGKEDKAFEAKDLAGTFTMDVIAATAFGLKIDSQKDPNNPFCENAKKVFDFNVTDPIVILIILFPFLVPLVEPFRNDTFPKGVTEFFTDVIKKAIQERKAHQSNRTDFLKLMLNAENELANAENEVKKEMQHDGLDELPTQGKLKGLTLDEIISQSFLFFVAGFETTANTMSFLMYRLATNEDIQTRLLEEIDDVMSQFQDVGYECVSKMTYLDMCVNETLRLTPPIPRLDRMASRDIEIKGLRIPKDTVVQFPYMALHMDPDVWPNPDKFDPERFTPEAKDTRSPFSFLPFGAGPRNCIGMRLALLEMKIAMVRILQRFRLVKCDRTEVPLTFKNGFITRSKNGLWMKVESR